MNTVFIGYPACLLYREGFPMHLLRRTVLLPSLAVLVATALAGEAPADPKPANTIVALTAQEPVTSNPKMDGGLLIRELARQALLIAARDELGLSTRDAALREPLGANAGATLSLKSEFTTGSDWTLTVTRAGSPDVLWTKKLPLAAAERVNYFELPPLMAELSRKDFVEMLKNAGFSAAVTPARPGSATLDADMEKALLRMSCTAQFWALRAIHALIREKGSSPEALAGLVRAYANLGRLSADQWTGASKAYRARALLYAERLVGANPNSAAALWARAYARAMSDYHGAALEDIAAAEKIEAAVNAANAPAPSSSWKVALELYCRFDTQNLHLSAVGVTNPRSTFADPSARELAAFFRYLAVEHSGSHALIVNVVNAMLRANPECYCVYNALWKIQGVSVLHNATVAAPQTMARTVYTRIATMPGLPATLADTLKESADADESARRTKIVHACANEAARDRGEPSWGVLGRMIEDLTFVQTAMRADFMKRIWGVDTSDYVHEALPLVADHPYRAAIEALGLDAERDGERINALLKDIDIADANYNERMLVDLTWKLNTPGKIQGRQAWNRAWTHSDDLTDPIEWGDGPTKRARAHELVVLSPFNPLGYATLINEDWDFAKEHAADWEKQLGQHAEVLRALSWRYSQLPSFPDAERCLAANLKLAPDRWGYDTLAEVYKKQGKIDLWQQTLDEYLADVEDPGLEHANVQVKIARYFMSRKQWDKAQPYADAAAQTWAEWAMMAARDCHEGAGDFQNAEMWQQRISERYNGSQLDWYFWCKRTGQGDVQKAMALVAEHFTSIAARQTPNDHEAQGIVELLENHPGKSLKHFQSAFAATNNPYDGMHAALLADALKNTELRDQLLADIAKKGPQFMDNGKPRPETIAVAAQFARCLQQGPDAALDVNAEDTESAAVASGEQININYFAGRFLELHGKKEQAQDYYDRAATGGDNRKWNLILATEALRKMGAKPGEFKHAPKADNKTDNKDKADF